MKLIQLCSKQSQLHPLKALRAKNAIGSLLAAFSFIIPTIPIAAKTITPHQPDAATKSKALAVYNQLPLSFEANRGQVEGQVDFLARGRGYNLFLTPTEAVLSLHPMASKRAIAKPRLNPKPQPIIGDRTAVLRFQLVGSNPQAKAVGQQQLVSKSNYLTGDNTNHWQINIANYAKVQYREVYPGIDLVYYGNQGQLEYDFVVAPGANPQNIRFRVAGASRLEIDRQGNLLLHTPDGFIRQHKPVIYQQINGKKKNIAGNYVLLGKEEVGFEVATYNRRSALVIDPVVSYSTYLGGSQRDKGLAIAVDRSGNVYITGSTASIDFPKKNFFDGTLSGSEDAFVTKLNPNAVGAASLVYSTYLGGNRVDGGEGIAVDLQNNVYVVGYTESIDFPKKNGFDSTLGNDQDGFVVKLNPTGNILLYSTYLGGTGSGYYFGGYLGFWDVSTAIAVDSLGNAYVTGFTNSRDFPVKNAFDSTFVGGELYFDAYATKINPAGVGAASLLYSTYLGGSDWDGGSGIAVDSLNHVYVTGLASSNNFPIKNAFDSTLGGGQDAFVTKLNPSLSGAASLLSSTFLGGSKDDSGTHIAVDASRNVYVTGYTQSTDFPKKNGFDLTLGGSQDAFVAKLNPSLSGAASLLYSTYLGGSRNDYGSGIAVDARGNAYVTGNTQSIDFPKKLPFDLTFAGTYEAFATKVNPAAVGAASLLYSSYLGGNRDDYGRAIAVDSLNNVYVTGSTTSTDFLKKNPFDSILGGTEDGFVTKIAP
jgi:hypothetical protein